MSHTPIIEYGFANFMGNDVNIEDEDEDEDDEDNELSSQLYWVKADMFDLLKYHSPSTAPLAKNQILNADEKYIDENNPIAVKIFLLLYHSHIKECVAEGIFTLDEIINSKIVNEIKEIKQVEQVTIFEFAVASGNLDSVKWLVEIGYDLGKCETRGLCLLLSIYSNNIEVVKYLLANGFDESAVKLENNTNLLDYAIEIESDVKMINFIKTIHVPDALF